jgi:biopolymer transport protein ExbD
MPPRHTKDRFLPNLLQTIPFIWTMRYSAPNVVPLLDVMFVLLLFFMLVVDFEGRQQEPMTLPTARSILESREWGRPLTINAHHRDDRSCYGRCALEEHWMLTVNGRDCSDPPMLRTTLVQEAALRRTEPVRDRRIIIRADGSAPYGLAQQAMAACAALGFKKVYVAASRKIKEDDR